MAFMSVELDQLDEIMDKIDEIEANFGVWTPGQVQLKLRELKESVRPLYPDEECDG